MKKIKMLALIGVLVSSCTHTVEFVRRDTTPTKQATVRYFPTDKPDIEAKYREDLNKKATSFCQGDYLITREYQARDESNSSAGIATGVGFSRSAIMVGGSAPRTSMYNFVEFVCR